MPRLTLTILLCAAVARSAGAQTAATTGATLYRDSCAACHGSDGKGMPRETVGFEVGLPDFTDCEFATPEPDHDWLATIHLGGPARAFDRMMPAFGEALSSEDIRRIVAHIRDFCTDRAWPRGELNLPRPLVTGKAFPENEVVVTTTVSAETPGTIENVVSYEHRLGARSEYEITVPFNFRAGARGGWNRGIGDVELGFKHAIANSATGFIVSGGADVKLPTGNEQKGLGGNLAIVEPFVAAATRLPGEAFVQVQSGVEFPLNNETVANEAFVRTAIGKMLTPEPWGRMWTPMFELVATRELGFGARTVWSGIPEVQVTLSRRQHIRLNGGVEIPLSDRASRTWSALMYMLWDFADGGFFSGW